MINFTYSKAHLALVLCMSADTPETATAEGGLHALPVGDDDFCFHLDPAKVAVSSDFAEYWPTLQMYTYDEFTAFADKPEEAPQGLAFIVDRNTFVEADGEQLPEKEGLLNIRLECGLRQIAEQSPNPSCIVYNPENVTPEEVRDAFKNVVLDLTVPESAEEFLTQKSLHS